MSDLIDRQAAIDAFAKGNWGVELDKALAEAIIKNVPSAQPQSTMGQVTDAVQSTKDCINRQDAIRWVKTECNPYGKPTLEFESGKKVIKHLEQMPSAQPQRIKGRWVRKESDLSWWYECSSCGESPLYDPYENEVRTPFCPWCGADMRGEQDG